MSISYDFVISVCQEKFHFRILNKKYFKTLKTHYINCYSLETIFLMTGNYFRRCKRSPWKRKWSLKAKIIRLLNKLLYYIIKYSYRRNVSSGPIEEGKKWFERARYGEWRGKAFSKKTLPLTARGGSIESADCTIIFIHL